MPCETNSAARSSPKPNWFDICQELLFSTKEFICFVPRSTTSMLRQSTAVARHLLLTSGSGPTAIKRSKLVLNVSAFFSQPRTSDSLSAADECPGPKDGNELPASPSSVSRASNIGLIPEPLLLRCKVYGFKWRCA